MKNEYNGWKIATIVLIIVALLLITKTIYNYNHNVNLGNVISIPYGDWNAIKNILEPNNNYKICSIQTGKCVIVKS